MLSSIIFTKVRPENHIAAIESILVKLRKKLDSLSTPVNDSQKSSQASNRLGSQHTNGQDRQPPPKENQGPQKQLYPEHCDAAPATSGTTCEGRPMYLFQRGNESSDDGSNTDSESHFVCSLRQASPCRATKQLMPIAHAAQV